MTRRNIHQICAPVCQWIAFVFRHNDFPRMSINYEELKKQKLWPKWANATNVKFSEEEKASIKAHTKRFVNGRTFLSSKMPQWASTSIASLNKTTMRRLMQTVSVSSELELSFVDHSTTLSALSCSITPATFVGTRTIPGYRHLSTNGSYEETWTGFFFNFVCIR